MTPVAPCPSAAGPAALGSSALEPSALQQFSPDQQAELAELLDRYLAGWEAGAPPSISRSTAARFPSCIISSQVTRPSFFDPPVR
mgnify:CR=1 FL=1